MIFSQSQHGTEPGFFSHILVPYIWHYIVSYGHAASTGTNNMGNYCRYTSHGRMVLYGAIYVALDLTFSLYMLVTKTILQFELVPQIFWIFQKCLEFYITFTAR